MYDVKKRRSGECSWLRSRHVYLWSCNKMVALGYVYTLQQTSHSPERSTSQDATSAEFLEVQIPPCVLVYNWDS